MACSEWQELHCGWGMGNVGELSRLRLLSFGLRVNMAPCVPCQRFRVSQQNVAIRVRNFIIRWMGVLQRSLGHQHGIQTEKKKTGDCRASVATCGCIDCSLHKGICEWCVVGTDNHSACYSSSCVLLGLGLLREDSFQIFHSKMLCLPFNYL